MQKPGSDHLRGNFQIREDAGNRDAVIDIRLARMTLLFAVRFLRHVIGAHDQLPVGDCVVFGELFKQFFKWNGCSRGFHLVIVLR